MNLGASGVIIAASYEPALDETRNSVFQKKRPQGVPYGAYLTIPTGILLSNCPLSTGDCTPAV